MSKRALTEIINNFNQSSFYPQIGIEIEFYLTQENQQISDQNLIQDFILELSNELKNNKIDILEVEKEQGLGQIEVKTNIYKNIDDLCSNIKLVKVISQDLALRRSLKTDFSPTPFIADCSNALQINFSLLDDQKNNLFLKNANQESKFLLNSIAGLIKNTPKNINYFIKNKNDLKRFDLLRNRELFKKGKYTSPVNLSWGYDNRSCAIRVVGKENQRRLEFRIADANIEIAPAICKFLEMVKDAIDNNSSPIKPIYGNAFDDQYLTGGLV